MKKILAIVLSAAALLLTLAGCGPKTASAGNASGVNDGAAAGENEWNSICACGRKLCEAFSTGREPRSKLCFGAFPF